jgi:hypothetical protein
MSKISGQIFCKNPAGNSSTANGTPFIHELVELTEGDTINPAQVSRNGKALSEIDFHDPQIIQAFVDADFVIPDCPNPNWIKVIVVTEMEITGKQWEDPFPNIDAQCFLTPGEGEFFNFSDCVVTDTLRTSCRIQDPYFENPASAIGVKSYNYACSEICHSSDPLQCDVNVPQ